MILAIFWTRLPYITTFGGMWCGWGGDVWRRTPGDGESRLYTVLSFKLLNTYLRFVWLGFVWLIKNRAQMKTTKRPYNDHTAIIRWPPCNHTVTTQQPYTLRNSGSGFALRGLWLRFYWKLVCGDLRIFGKAMHDSFGCCSSFDHNPVGLSYDFYFAI